MENLGTKVRVNDPEAADGAQLLASGHKASGDTLCWCIIGARQW